MPHFVYVLKSEDTGRLYTGMTKDLSSRLSFHNSGKVRSTKAYRPWTLVYYEDCNNQAQARKREVYLKSGFGRKFLRGIGIQ
jgi:putative endonuclease